MIDQLHRKRRKVLDKLASGTRSQAFARRLADQLARIDSELRLLEPLSSVHHSDAGPTIVLSSWMLRDSFHICTETPAEGMHFIAAVKIARRLIGTAISTFAYERRSVAGAAGERRSTHAQMIESAETGHSIAVIAHSHPGSGPHANHPSGTDIATHRLWEQTGTVIGAIWSRDGYLRFFTAGTPFRVEVVGSHLEQVDEHLWKLRDEYLAKRPALRGGAA